MAADDIRYGGGLDKQAGHVTAIELPYSGFCYVAGRSTGFRSYDGFAMGWKKSVLSQSVLRTGFCFRRNHQHVAAGKTGGARD